ncbi:hypothetical protein [Bradyrhizobium sp. CCBAU 45384]|uniref:hypothetical protein n=1 Tax=Bradyrhizobium sp. CCBAU 45384 TaxID=858428 RepID=UPI00230640CA|nr:hypothetical protein [Bradyrhizobium sp. CCBAU 45384]MDA9408899.1 hypothetical protein [Bradyrhizobium sp. CCBAU 45384]
MKATSEHELRYPEFDQGSRAQWTMGRLAHNAHAYAKAAAKAERQASRLRERQLYYARLAREDERLRDHSERGEAARKAHARHRLAEIAFWLNELDLLFLALLGLREAQLVRRSVWANRFLGRREHLRTGGRGRP